jgi:Uma2 family endonuclease
MSLPEQKALYAPDEYLALEREAEERHEWLDGLIYAMAGESPAHSIITSNLIATLKLQLRGRPCVVFSPNMKIYSRLLSDKSLKGLFSYADTMVVCGKPLFHDKHCDVIVNPTVIIEVVSKSTEACDRGEKFTRYKQNRSLTDYLLVSQSRPSIDHFTRKPKGRWEYSSEIELTKSIHIASIKCRLLLFDVYDRIEFPDDAEPESPLA